MTALARRSEARTVPAHLVLIIAVAYFLTPIVWLAFAATKSNGELFKGGFGPSGVFALWDNLAQLFTLRDGIFWTWLANSLLYSVVGSVVAGLLAAAAGYAFAKFRFPFKETAFTAVLASIMVPASALALPLYLMFSQVQLTDTIWSVLLPSCLSPLGVYLARVYCAAAIPDELIESARIDGAGEFRIFTQMALPLISPGLVTILLFQFIAIWNNFFLPYVMLSSADMYTAALGLQALSVSPAENGVAYYNLVLTGSLVSIVPLVLTFLLLQRWWKNGLSLGSVVG